MLLRIITKHVKDQNWFAVFLDFIIVVFGVFIGIQVSNWNEARVAAQSERQYLDRLHEEVVTVLAQRDSNDRTRRDDLDLMKEVSEILYGRAEARPLTALQCEALSAMHIMDLGANALPTADELISSGRLELIRVALVRKEVIQFQQAVTRAEKLVNQMQDTVQVLPRAFPELYTRTVRPSGADDINITLTAECDGTAMQANKMFLNSFADSLDRYDAYVRRAINSVTTQLERLHAEIDDALSIEHGDDE